MTCLVHDVHYRSLFHGVVNELRHENRIHSSHLRNMPHKCCTCKDIDKLTLISVILHDKETLKNLQKLIDQINRNKQTNPKLILALNKLENFIKENRAPAPSTSLVTTTDIHMDEIHDSMFDSDDETPMNIEKKRVAKQKKPPKPLKNGTFLFLPYKFEDKPTSNTLLDVAKTLQRGRFLGRNKYTRSIEKKHNAYINMITSKTSEQIKCTLENAKAKTGNVKIHNEKDLSEEDGEWLLVRPKKTKDQINATDFEALLNELKDRWDSFLKVRKRKTVSVSDDDDDDDDDDDAEHPNKK